MLFDPILCLGFLLVVVGTGTFIGTGSQVLKARQGKNWPTVPGKIVYSDVRSSDIGEQTTYNARVVVAYAVDGLGYESQDRLFAGERSEFNTYQTALKQTERFTIGDEVTVYYNPRYPDDMTLEPKVAFGLWIAFAVSIIFLLAGLALVVLTYMVNPPVGPSS